MNKSYQIILYFYFFAACLLAQEKTASFDFGFQKIASDIRGAEGPAVDSAGKIFVVSPRQGILFQLVQGTAKIFARLGSDPCGLQIDEKGRIWIALGDEGIFRLEKDGKLTPLVTEFEGMPIKGSNDLALDGQGNLYFTVPIRDEPKGRVFWFTKEGRVECFDKERNFPNGIAISPDKTFLVYAETRTRKLWRWDLDASGKPLKKTLFAELPGSTDRGGDGVDFDAEGNLLVANYGEGSIDVFKADGSLNERIMLPFKNPSNLEFIQGSSNEWIVTEHENKAVWKFRWKNGGSKLRTIGEVDLSQKQ